MFSRMVSKSPSVTKLLLEWGHGSSVARDELMPLVYEELRRLAGARLRDERADHTLQATAIVHEAYLRLVDQRRVRWRNRAHFFAIAARMIRRILVDHARRRQAGKRGGGRVRVTMDEEWAGLAERDLDLVALDEALRELAELDPELARLVEMRFFGGLTIEETAAALEISPATVKREWAAARAWLRRRIGGDTP
jgi:RNA polymerase sigma factor (TIGR02999 family)